MYSAQKGFAATLLLLVILIALLGIGYFVYNSKNSTQNTQGNAPLKQTTVSVINPNTLEESKIYRNDLGFQFSYSNPLKVIEDSEDAYYKRSNGDMRENFSSYVGYEVPKTLGIFELVDDPKNIDSAPVSIWVFENPANLSPQAYFSKYWYYPFMWGDFSSANKAKLKPSEESTISGQLASSMTVSYQQDSPKYIYLPTTDGKMYLIRILESGEKTGDQVLSSFKLN